MPKSLNDQNLRKTYIIECIEIISNGKQKFDNLTALAKYVALRVSEQEFKNWGQDKIGSKPKPMAHQTLLTNKKYKKLLLDFMGKNEEDKHILENALVKATLLGKELEIKSLKESVERLEKAISEAYSSNTNNEKIVSNNLNKNDKDLLVIHKLISEFNEFVVVNENKGLSNIVNFPPTEIATADELSNYVLFLKENKL